MSFPLSFYWEFWFLFMNSAILSWRGWREFRLRLFLSVSARHCGAGKTPREPPGKFRPFLWGGTVSFWVMPTLLPQRPTKRRKSWARSRKRLPFLIRIRLKNWQSCWPVQEQIICLRLLFLRQSFILSAKLLFRRWSARFLKTVPPTRRGLFPMTAFWRLTAIRLLILKTSAKKSI